MPSRIPGFLCEFLEVLLLVVQPLSDLTDLSAERGAINTEVHHHSSQATYIRSILDPVLIEQEIKRGVFDPSGLLQTVGYALKDHCAPMRDSAVDEMIQVAKSCQGEKISPSSAFEAFRMCMELLEVMKLVRTTIHWSRCYSAVAKQDIANHQLQSLRPYLIRTSGQNELKMFQSRDSDNGLKRTSAWIRRSRNALLAQEQTKIHQSRPPEIRAYSKLSINQQIHLATMMGLVDLVFSPPTDRANAATSSTLLDESLTATAYPETLYLDTSRLPALSSEAAELMALYMSLLLYRQLIQVRARTGSGTVSPSLPRLQKLKAELRDISGSRLGYCFSRRHPTKRHDMPDKRGDRCSLMRDDIALQIARHAHNKGRTAQQDSADGYDAPDKQLCDLARSWVATNFHPDSSLSALARDRLRNAVLDGIVRTTSRRDTCLKKLGEPHIDLDAGGEIKDAGTEPLTDEIRILVYKITRLASVHLGTYLPLYEQDGFLEL